MTIGLVLAGAALLLAERASDLGLYDLGAVIGPLDGDWWRLIAAQFVYENVGYLFVVGVATAIFGTSLERRYGPLVVLAVFLGAGAAGMYLASEVVDFPLAVGGNASALGLLCAWTVLDFREPARRQRSRDRPVRCGGDRRAARRDADPRGRPPTPGPVSPAPRSAPSPGWRCRSAPRAISPAMSRPGGTPFGSAQYCR